MGQRSPGPADVITNLLITALAILWAWEYLLILTPVRIPAWLQPALVAGCAIEAHRVPGWILTACAVAGAVALLHRVLTPTEVARVIPRRRSGRVPPV